MSDADSQMGGSGGEPGQETGKVPGGDSAEESHEETDDGSAQVDRESEESFPASDPPANY